MAPLVPIAGVSLCQWLLGCFSSRFLCPRIAGHLRTMVLFIRECFVQSWGQHQSVPCADDKTWIDLALLDALPQRLHLAHDVILGRSSW
jgi:hypothetical protein